MSCRCRNEYDCYCDYADDYEDDAWELLENDVERRYHMTEFAFDNPRPDSPTGLRSPIWWMLLSPPPPGLTVREESEELDRISTYQQGRMWQAPIVSMWLELPYPPNAPNYRWGYGETPLSRWVINRYEVKRDDEGSPWYLTSAFASAPPNFGWWMPSLRSPW